MSKKLLDILPTLQTFQDSVISQLTNMFNGVEWLNDTTSYTKQETIYKLLILKYGDRQIRYDDENIFLNRLVFDLADFLPDIYAKQQVFIKNKLNEFLSDNKNRAVIIDNTSTNSRNTDNNTKFGNSSSPLNLVISNANEITNAPITSLNLSNVKLLENYNGNNQQVNYNFVNDLIKTLNNDYSLRLNEFMELLGKHFISVVGGYYRNSNDIQTVKDEPYRFNNGYLVNEVDYLCTDNKQEINRFNEKLGRLNDQVATKQNQLTAGSNISINNNVISANIPQTDLSNYYTKQEIDTQEQQQNTNIENNYLKKNGSLQIVNAFVDFYGNIVAKNNGYVDNVDTGARTSMINKEYLEQQLNPINTNISTNTANITNLDNKVNTNTTNISSNSNSITNLENRTNTIEQNYVSKTTTAPQTIASQITFTQTNEVMKFNSGTDNAAYLSGYKSNNQRVWYFGKGSSTSNNFVIGADRSDIKLEPSGKVDLSNKKIGWLADPTADQDAANKRYVDNAIATAAPTGLVNRIQAVETKSTNNETNITTIESKINNEVVKLTEDQTIAGTKTFNSQIVANEGLTTGATKSITSGYLELGFGDSVAYITPEDGSNKVLKFGGRSGKGKFDIDLQRQSQLMGVNDPARPYHAANKNYVDNYINYREQVSTINVGTQIQINPTTNYQIIDLKVARKRSEGFWFFDYHTTLNIQLFIHTNGKYTIYNNGNVSGFNNDFKIFIIEKKV